MTTKYFMVAMVCLLATTVVAVEDNVVQSTNMTPINETPIDGKLIKARFGVQRESLAASRQAKDILRVAKESFRAAKKDLKACEGVDSQACYDLRREVNHNLRNAYMGILDVVDQAHEKARAVYRTKNFPDELLAPLVGELNARASELYFALGTVEALDSESSFAELKEAKQMVRQVWRDSRWTLRRISAASVGGKLNNKLDKLEGYVAELEGLNPGQQERLQGVKDAIVLLRFEADALLQFAEQDEPVFVSNTIRVARKSLKEAVRTLQALREEVTLYDSLQD